MKNSLFAVLIFCTCFSLNTQGAEFDQAKSKPTGHKQDAKRDIATLFGAASKTLETSSALINNIKGRESRSLNGKWAIIVDEHRLGERGLFGGGMQVPPKPLTGMELVEHSFDSRRELSVPGDWNTQDNRLFRYRDVVWYQRNVNVKKRDDQRYFLHFDGVNYSANVYVNGHAIASHTGGYVAFNVEVTDALIDGDNFVVVRVDGHLDDSSIPTLKSSDFFKYSGITRDVNLVAVPETFVRQYHVYLKNPVTKNASAWVQLDGPERAGQRVSLHVAGTGNTLNAITNQEGLAEFDFVADVTLWSPDQPKLYPVEVTTPWATINDKIGFRTIAIEGKRILLNGQPIFLRGISMHDESYLKSGVAFDERDARAQLGLIKELNGNFVRLAHYPHNEHVLRVADELGLLVWSEVPVVSLIDWENPDTLKIAKRQISDNVYRDLNRASIVMWSIANETMPQSAERLTFLRQLAEVARGIDRSNRPIAAALVGDVVQEFTDVTKRLVAELLNDPLVTDIKTRKHLELMAKKMIGDSVDEVLNSEINVILKDSLGSVVDVIGYNEYFGWYYSAFLSQNLPVDERTTRRTMFRIMPDIRFKSVFDKPIIISEFGAGAKKGYKSPYGKGSIWTEEYQAKVYRHQLDMLSRSDSVQGMSPWILKDFRSALRQLNGIQENYNRKGIVSEQGEKKQAFYVLKDFYNKHADALVQ